MLVVEINPPAKKAIEVSPFSSTTIDLNYMTAIARPYAPGADTTNFQVQFGTLRLNESNVVEGFSNQLDSQLRLTKEELETWGTNDEVLLGIVATKLGVTAVSFVDVPGNSF